MAPPHGPKLSVIICIFNMSREAPRTILSACTPYQKRIDPADYELIVVDNGSSPPFRFEPDPSLRPQVRVLHMPAPRPSPVFALNWAARTAARGDILLFAIDGARIFSDHLVASSLRAHAIHPGPFVYTLGCHIGPKVQMISTAEGYDEREEDRLIAASGWPQRPAALYDISVLAGSSLPGFFRPIAESNAFSLPRALLEQYGSFDERFVSPGGGLANLDMFARYVSRPDAINVCLLSDMTFHQTHGGVATSGKSPWADFDAEYRSIFGKAYRPPRYQALYQGPVRPEAVRFLEQSCAALCAAPC